MSKGSNHFPFFLRVVLPCINTMLPIPATWRHYSWEQKKIGGRGRDLCKITSFIEHKNNENINHTMWKSLSEKNTGHGGKVTGGPGEDKSDQEHDAQYKELH